MEHAVLYYRLAGRLYRDRHFEWRPGYVTDSATGYHEPPKDTDFAVRLLDGKERILIDHPITVTFGNRHDDPSRAHLREKVPWSEETASLVLLEGGREIFRAQRPDTPPDVAFDPDVEPLSRGPAGEPVTLRWEARSRTDLQLYYYLSYSFDAGQRFLPLGTRRLKPIAGLLPGQLPGGKDCRLRLRVTDGLNTVEAFSRSFSRPWMPPTAEIHWPQDGEKVRPGAPIEVSGHGMSSQESFPDHGTIEWSVDGKPAGTRPRFLLEIPEDGDSVVLELTVTDSTGASDSVVHKLVLGRDDE